jgi:ABC-type multidrug transport system ATPase subunit
VGPGAEIADIKAGASTSDALLTLSGVQRNFGPNQVLRGVDLEVPRGSRGFLGGNNGAGKTTLLRIVSGVLAPSAGTVSLDGLDPIRDRGRFQQRLGYLPAGNGGLYARLTVRQNLEFWGALALLPRDRSKAAIDEAIEDFGLTELAGNRCDRISMGQRQRVRLATTFLHQPTLVLLDEPHTSLDDPALELLRRALDAHHDRGGTSLWCAPASTQASIESEYSWIVDEGLVRQL